MNDYNELILRWQLASKILDDSISKLVDLKNLHPSLPPLPQITRYIPKSQSSRYKGDIISIKGDSGNYIEYNRVLWERILLHGHPSLFPNHIQNCRSQYEYRKPQVKKHIDKDWSVKIEVANLLEDVKSAKSFNDFKIKKIRYDALITQLQRKKDIKIQEVVKQVKMYEGMNFPDQINPISNFEI